MASTSAHGDPDRQHQQSGPGHGRDHRRPGRRGSGRSHPEEVSMTSPESTPIRRWTTPGSGGRPPPRGARRGRSRHRAGRGAATGQLHRGQSRGPARSRLSPQPGQVHDHRPPGCRPGDAPSINNRGQIVGAYDTPGTGPRVRAGPRALHQHRGAGRPADPGPEDQRPGQLVGDYEDARASATATCWTGGADRPSMSPARPLRPLISQPRPNRG